MRRGGARRRSRALLLLLRRKREQLRALLVDDDVAALDGLVIKVLECVRPGLAGRLAAARGVVLLAIGERGRQFRILATGGRHRLRYVLAGVAMGVERGLCGRAHALAGLLVVAELSLCR